MKKQKLAENMLRFGPKNLTSFQRNRLMIISESPQSSKPAAAMSTLPKQIDIFWTSCDGQDHNITPETYELIKLVPNTNKIEFSGEPKEKYGEYSIQSCVTGQDHIVGLQLSFNEYNGKYYLMYLD
jgi:hypothetical protein